MTIAQRLREEGREAGREEGRHLGVAQGIGAMLTRQLTLKFGPPPAAALARIQSAAPEELERWTDRVVTGVSLHDVLEG